MCCIHCCIPRHRIKRKNQEKCSSRKPFPKYMCRRSFLCNADGHHAYGKIRNYTAFVRSMVPGGILCFRKHHFAALCTYIMQGMI